jgi:hypothetical protein
MDESVQIERSESRELYIFFGGLASGIAMPPFEFFNASRIFDGNKIFLRDARKSWYQTGLPGVTRDIPSTVRFLSREIEAIAPQRTVFVGNSMGGFAAILFSVLLGVGEVVAFAPQTFVSPVLRFRHRDHRWRRPIATMWLASFLKPRQWDLRPVLKRLSEPRPVSIHVSKSDRLDIIHAAHLENLPGVKVHEHEDGDHGVVKLLRDRGELPAIMRGRF